MWILPKQLASNSALDTAAFTSDSKELSEICAVSLLVRSKVTRSRTWFQKLKPDSWSRFLSGRILKPSHANSFETWWTSSVRAIRASHSQPPADGKGKMTRDICGLLCGGQLRLFDPDIASLKTWKDMSRKDCAKFLPNWLCSDTEWKTAVASQRGEYSRQLKKARRMVAKEFSFSQQEKASSWTTPCANKINGTTREDFHPALCEQVNWPTPTETLAPSSNSNAKNAPKNYQEALNWKTPKADERGQYQRDRGTKGLERPNLTGQAKLWPTARLADAQKGTRTQKGCEQERLRRKNGNDLITEIKLATVWPSPRSRDWKGNGFEDNLPNVVNQNEKTFCAECKKKKTAPGWTTCKNCGMNSFAMTKEELRNQYSGPTSPQDPAKLNTTGNRAASLVLNADWVEVLMDVPRMWTDCDCLATESIPPVPQKHLSLSTTDLRNEKTNCA